MSDDSDCGPRQKRKRNIRYLDDSASSASTSTGSSTVTTSRRRLRRRHIEDDSDSDSGSSIEIHPKRKAIPRVASDADSDSSGSVIIQRSKRPARVVSDSESSDSDHGFEGSSSSQWETDVSDTEAPKCTTAKVQDTGVDSDSSDGQSEKCPICLISFANQEVGTPETCDHMFCVECIQEWSKNMNTCPVDRQEYHIILVRKNINGSIYKQIPIQAPNPQNEVDDIVEDPTFCEVCGLSDREDRMLLCDGCDLGFHLDCLTPQLTDIPAGAWFCNDCSPEDLVDPEIELYELQLLLDDAHEMGRPRSRRRTSSRLVPRTRQSERVRRRIASNRTTNQPSTSPTEPQPVTSTTASRRPKKKKKKRKKPRYRVVYRVDEATGETIAVKKRVKKRRKRRPLPPPRSARQRLATQLGMCAPRNVPQNLPDVRIPPPANNLHSQRSLAGIPTLRLFGDPDQLELFSEDEGDGSGVIARRGIVSRRPFVKSVTLTDPVSSTTDLLGSILDAQTRFHSKSTKFSLGNNGQFTMELSEDRVLRDMNNYDHLVRRAPASYSSNSRDDNKPSCSGRRNSSLDRNPPNPNPAFESTSVTASAAGSTDNPEDYTDANLCTIYDVQFEDHREKKKREGASEDNSRSGTPASESEIDIYSDIETVSTSKADDGDVKAPSPLPVTPNGGTDDENNDSEPDMVIDTEKANPEPEEDNKEETTVTSTVDSVELAPFPPTVTSTSEIQSQAVQSSNEVFDKNPERKIRDEDEDSEDECPNFSIYSKESITMAKNTDITLGSSGDPPQENNQVGEVSSSPADKPPARKVEVVRKPSVKKPSLSTALYSDSEDESVVKRGVENSFGIIDIRNMTEDISEEERSYTPCLDERPHFRQGIEGLDTEMISDEERNDFDESHELKTASEGDALEINAKESELDFTRPEDYEEGEIVDKSKNKNTEEVKKPKEDTGKKAAKKDEETDKAGNKENENQNTNTTKESAFKKLSKNTKERNYRDKDKDRVRSKSREKRSRDNRKDRRKRKEIERYDVRALIAEKPRRLKDKFGRDVRRSASRSKTRTPSLPRRSLSRYRNASPPKIRRSNSRPRRSISRRRSLSRNRNRKKRRISKNQRSLSRSRSRSPDRGRSRSKTKKRKRSVSRDKRKKSLERSKGKTKKPTSRSRQRSRSPTPKRPKEWNRRHSREWSASLSRSRTPEARHPTPSWTPPRLMDNTVKPHNLTVILTNDSNKKKKEKKKKLDKKTKENERGRKKKRNERTPPPSKEVFASGDNILVSVSFNKDNETRDVSTKKKREADEANKKAKKDKPKRKKRSRDLTGIKPVAIIDLERSPFKELTPSPKDVIVLSDSETEETRNVPKGLCDSSQQVASPERLGNNYTTGPKTPPEPQVKFTLTKQTQLRAITNPLHEPDDIEPEGDTEEVVDGMHKGPNTPPEPPNSPPSSPDAYDPFEPTKSRSASPEPMQTTQSNSTLNLDDNREDSILEPRTEMDKSNNSSQPPDALKPLTPPSADVQPADSQSSIQVTPESSLSKSPERSTSATVQTQTITASKPIAQTIPFSSSVPTSLMTSTPVSTSLALPRITILNSTIITPPHVVSSIPQRIVLPNTVKPSPVKISPTKPPIKSTPIKPMPSKTPRKSNNRNQNGNDTVESNLGLDSPYSPGSSDYEDLFEPPVETAPKPALKPAAKNSKSPTKIQNAFDALFGTSPFNKIKTKPDKQPTNNKFNKKSATVSAKGSKQVGVKLDEDNLKILDELPNSAVEMQVKDKFLKKLNRQERVVEEVKLVLKPHYNKKHINKEEYKDILRRSVPKICHNKSGEINPTKIKNLIEAYVKKVRHSKKVTSSSSSLNPLKA